MKQDSSVYLSTCKGLPFVEVRTALNSSVCYHTHSHDEFSFGVIDNGTAKYRNRKSTHRVYRTDTVTINPGDVHSCNPDSSEWSYRMLFVDTAWIGAAQAELCEKHTTDYQGFLQDYESEKALFTRFNALYNVLIQDVNPLAAETYLLQYIQRWFGQEDQAAATCQKIASSCVHRVREKLFDQLATNHSLHDLAMDAGLSRYHLIRKFKEVYGLSPHALQIDERIKRAKKLLKQGETIADASVQLGFADQAHFQRNFKKRLAITPKQYQSFFI
ncbi:helix-turn-helix domain-containing protein [Halodesulfovibrio aestuarii]|uniref:helix-turn-helix domain-containing protein n=1 Tax=Halodesulfovibrio aestuarii TaxID=126333 RepID=UPI003D340731